MRKIETGKHGKSLDELALMHYQNLCKYNWKSPKHAFSERKKQLSGPISDFLEKCLEGEEFKRIITARPDDLDRIARDNKKLLYQAILESGEKDDTVRKTILDIFRYDAFRESNAALQFAESLGIRACPYCNSQFVLYSKSGIRCHFDHILPKSLYPYLSLSFFNLVPTCGSCNQSKGKAERVLLDPYKKSLADKFDFKLKNDTIVDALLDIGKDPFKRCEINVQLRDAEVDEETQNHLKQIGIEDIYNQFPDIVEEIFQKSRYYNESRKAELAETLDDWLADSNSKTLIDRIIVGNYTLPEDINQRPLSKFMSDIAKEAGLIRRQGSN